MLREKSIGIIGGGQLAQMFIEECNRYGIRINVLDNKDCPAYSLSTSFIDGDVKSEHDIRHLSKFSDTLTFELENINADVLLELEREGKDIIPHARVLKLIQDKTKQKEFFHNIGVDTLDFRVCDKVEDISKAVTDMNLDDEYVIKLDKGGYDGKGVFVVRNNLLVKEILSHQGRFLIERYCPHIREFSLISYMDRHGMIGHYPLVEMIFNKELNLIDYLLTQTNIEKNISDKIRCISEKILTSLGSPGLFAIEIFLVGDDIFVNEISPRPHNSGHTTIESSETSQFEQLMRILMDWPCGDTKNTVPTAMVNILGPDHLEGDYSIDFTKLLGTSGTYLHIYRKSKTKPGRKMGHVTITGNDMSDLENKIMKVKQDSLIKPPK